MGQIKIIMYQDELLAGVRLWAGRIEMRGTHIKLFDTNDRYMGMLNFGMPTDCQRIEITHA